jgi:predicted GIY-YIG superfamily endonuclease
MHWMYVLQHDVTKEIYIGKTDDIKRRLAEHNRGNQTATQRKAGLWHLLYAELYRSKRDADARELKLKQHGSNKRWLMNRIKHSKLED